MSTEILNSFFLVFVFVFWLVQLGVKSFLVDQGQAGRKWRPSLGDFATLRRLEVASSDSEIRDRARRWRQALISFSVAFGLLAAYVLWAFRRDHV